MKHALMISVAGAICLTLMSGSLSVALALRPKIEPGKTYCQCSCSNSTGTNDLVWEKVASCSLNSRNCKFNNPSNQGKLEAGKLSSCMQCKSDAPGSLLCGGTRRLPPDMTPIPPMELQTR